MFEIIAGLPRDFPSGSLFTPFFPSRFRSRQSRHATNARKEPHTKAHPLRWLWRLHESRGVVPSESIVRPVRRSSRAFFRNAISLRHAFLVSRCAEPPLHSFLSLSTSDLIMPKQKKNLWIIQVFHSLYCWMKSEIISRINFAICSLSSRLRKLIWYVIQHVWMIKVIILQIM